MARLRYPFARPQLPEPEAWLPFLAPAYEARWFSNGGPVGRALEAELAERVGGGRELVLASSATSGITAALIALDVRGSVAVPAFTFPATIHAIEAAGCTPVLCDVDPATWELSPEAAADAVELHGCTAIVHVRAFGLCRDGAPIEQVARAHGVPMVVDAAACFGGREPDGTPVGRRGDAEVFSFHATKVFAIGEGGAIASSPELAARIRHVANFAIAGSDVTGRGLNAKLADTSAAIGRAMLRRLDADIAVRAEGARRIAQVAEAQGVRVPGAEVGTPPWQCVPLELPADVDRDAVLASLAADGIEGRAYYCPGLHRSSAWESFASGPLPATDAVALGSMCMPLYSDLTAEELELFVASLDAAITGARRGEARRAA